MNPGFVIMMLFSLYAAGWHRPSTTRPSDRSGVGEGFAHHRPLGSQ